MATFAYTGTESQNAFLRQLYSRDAEAFAKHQYTRATLCAAANDLGLGYPPAWIVKDPSRSVGRGIYNVPEIAMVAAGASSGPGSVPVTATVTTAAPKRKYTRRTPTPSIPSSAPTVTPVDFGTKFDSTPVEAANRPSIASCEIAVDDALRPKRPEWYVENKIHGLLHKIFSSRRFVPVFVYGHKGTGKTTAALAAAADCAREVYRVNITSETSEDDLLGGFRLVGGETVWADGPVTLAMKRGAILVLDEMDRGDRKILCLQPILEGNPVLLKKIGRVVVPQPGFTIVATGNTRGRGSEDNRYNGAYVQDEALLDRFHIGFHQDFPEKDVETRILVNVAKHVEHRDDNFIKCLVAWANQIRKTFAETGDGEIVSTRNLVDAVRLLPILGNEDQVIESVCGKFDPVTAKSFVNLYGAVKASPRNASLESGLLEMTGATAEAGS